MIGVFEGFATIGVLIVVGIVIAHFDIIDANGQRTLSMVAFFVASPALLFTVLSTSDLGAVFSGNLVASGGAVVVTVAVFVVVAIGRGDDLGHGVIGSMCTAYVNAGNLGIPIAAYVLDDATLVAPVLLMQLLVLQPLALTVLDVAVSPTRLSVWRVLRRPLTNPITVASVLGLACAVSDVELPRAAADPLELIAGMAVPSMLLAYGAALRHGPLPGRGVTANELGIVLGLKLVCQPVVAYMIGRLIGLSDANLLAVTVLSALPTAQNVFIMATRYQRGLLLARDAIFVSTVASVPVVLLIAALLA